MSRSEDEIKNSTFILLGRRRNDLSFMVDFHLKRAMVRANYAWIDKAFPLEIIVPGISGYQPAMILIRREWRRIYAVNIRAGWEENDYFDLADKLIVRNRILEP